MEDPYSFVMRIKHHLVSMYMIFLPFTFQKYSFVLLSLASTDTIGTFIQAREMLSYRAGVIATVRKHSQIIFGEACTDHVFSI